MSGLHPDSEKSQIQETAASAVVAEAGEASPRFDRIAAVMRMVAEDCEADAARLDRTPFTPRGMGETFGSLLAQIKALATAIEVIATALTTAAAPASSETGNHDV